LKLVLFQPPLPRLGAGSNFKLCAAEFLIVIGHTWHVQSVVGEKDFKTVQPEEFGKIYREFPGPQTTWVI